VTASPTAFIFDFNGTLSDDERIMYEVIAELFAELGRPLTEPEYREQLAGLSDEAIIETWMGPRDDLAELVARRVDGYRARVGDGSTISPDVRAAVRYAAGRVPIAVVSGASAAEILPMLAAADLTDQFTAVVSSDDVADGKPHPEGYLQAIELLGVAREPARVVAFEDTEAGVASATAAGLTTIAVAGTHPAERLAAATRIVPGLTVGLIAELLAYGDA